MPDKIKLLFYGDAPTAATGFGTVSRNLLTGLHQTGNYEIEVMGVNYWGDPHGFPFPIWPVGVGDKQDPYGRQRATDMMLSPAHQYDVLLMCYDTFILGYMDQVMPVLRSSRKFAAISYFPVDGCPKAEWMRSMDLFDAPVTYTEYARRQAIAAHPALEGRLKVIPHGAASTDFYPASAAAVSGFRKNYFGKHADKFIVTNVNRNQQRKDIPRTLMAFKEFQRQRPDSVLYLHLAARDQGWFIPEIIKSVGLVLGEHVLLPGRQFGPANGFAIDVLNLIYNCSDVVVSTTSGEGWGLSSVEAMACKTPVIFPDNTSLTEIVGQDRGYLVRSGATPNDFVILPNDNEILRPITDIMHMAETLTHVHDHPEEAAARAEVAYDWIAGSLSWDRHIVPQWDRLITDCVRKLRHAPATAV